MEVERQFLLDTLFTLMRILRHSAYTSVLSKDAYGELKGRAKELRDKLGIGFAEAGELYTNR